jgi:hypothetical protein
MFVIFTCRRLIVLCQGVGCQLLHFTGSTYVFPSATVRQSAGAGWCASSTGLLEELAVRPASQQIPRLLLNRNVHYRDHKNLPPVCNQGQINSIQHSFILFVPKIHFNIILLSMLGTLFQVSEPTFFYTFLTTPCALRILPISFLILSSH